MKASDLVTRRVRGFRVVDIAAMALFLALALAVYAFKTSAGVQRTDIADVESQIRDETRDVRLLQAQVAGLESEDRIERLARAYAGQAPVGASQVITPADLPRIAAEHPAPAAANAAPAANVAAPEAAR